MVILAALLGLVLVVVVVVVGKEGAEVSVVGMPHIMTRADARRRE